MMGKIEDSIPRATYFLFKINLLFWLHPLEAWRTPLLPPKKKKNIFTHENFDKTFKSLATINRDTLSRSNAEKLCL